MAIFLPMAGRAEKYRKYYIKLSILIFFIYKYRGKLFDIVSIEIVRFDFHYRRFEYWLLHVLAFYRK